MPVNSGRKMAWCSHCGRICNTSHDHPTNNTSCVDCGKILFEGNLTTNELIYTNRISHATRHYKGRETIWCPHCVRKGRTVHDHSTGIIHCVDCGKILFEEDNTTNAIIYRDARGGKDKRLKLAQTKKKRPSSKMNYEPIPVKANDETEDEYSKSDGHQWKGFDNPQESCSDDYDYNYSYDGGDENNDY